MRLFAPVAARNPLLRLFPLLLALAGASGPASAVTGHAFKAGETLGQIAETYYGNKHYDLVIIKLNRIKDPAKIPPGTLLRVPDLKEMLLTEGFPKSLDAELDDISKARWGFMRVHEQLMRALTPGNGEKGHVPAEVRRELRADADGLDKAGRVLAKQGNFSESATRMRQRLSKCADTLRKLAVGTDPDLEDSVHLLLAQTFVRGLMWARNEDGDVKEWQ
jgi:hypothetical protein